MDSFVASPEIFSKERWPTIRSLAMRQGASFEATRKWFERRRIPGDWHLPLLDAAASAGVALERGELLSMTRIGRE